MGQEENDSQERQDERPAINHSRVMGLVSFFFILVQSVCTAIMAVSGLRVLIGLGALAAAAGLHRPARSFHGDWVRIPMMTVAVAGSVSNLFMVWRIRSLRARASSRWRVRPVSTEQRRSEWCQIALAVASLLLVLAEWATHRIVHDAP